MSMHPYFTTSAADQRRAAMLAGARRQRQIHTARTAASRPSRRSLVDFVAAILPSRTGVSDRRGSIVRARLAH